MKAVKNNTTCQKAGDKIKKSKKSKVPGRRGRKEIIMNINNHVFLLGNLTRDPEVRTFNKKDGNSSSLSRFTLAVSRGFKAKDNKEKDTDFFDCVAFGSTAKRVEKFCAQGKRVAVMGSLQNQDPYTNKEGATVYPRDVLVVQDITPAAFAFAQDGGQNASANGASGGGFSPEEPSDLPY